MSIENVFFLSVYQYFFFFFLQMDMTNELVMYVYTEGQSELLVCTWLIRLELFFFLNYVYLSRRLQTFKLKNTIKAYTLQCTLLILI